ncbi:MAG: hypothetical protein QM775_34205 [Pirellulales bacterium]
MGFHFFHEKPREGADDDDKLYYLALEVLLPWHVDYKKPDTGTPHPMVRLLHADLQAVADPDLRPPIRYGVSSAGDGFGYYLDLKFQVDEASELFHDLTKLRMLVSRDGIFSQP